MNKTPIEPDDIRKGDKIRWERKGEHLHAVEYDARWDEDGGSPYGANRRSDIGSYYLLDRPKPAVELPEKPTLGWLTLDTGIEDLGIWGDSEFQKGAFALQRERDVRADVVTSFTPAIAAPLEAYEALEGWDHVDFAHSREGAAIHDFCRAVREANGVKP